VQKLESAMPKPTGYSKLQVRLHWLSAILMILLLTILGETIGGGWRSLLKSDFGSYPIGAWLHIIPGLLIVPLAVWRLILRFWHGAPELPENEQRWAQIAAHITHWSLIALLFIVPLSGLWAWVDSSKFLAEAHGVLQGLIWVFLGLHVVGALVHHYILRTNVLRRMLKAEE